MDGFSVSPEKILFLPVLLFSIICHEIGHAYAAFKGGDDTARLQGRISLNPLVHIDPVGTIIMPALQIFGGVPLLGWARPVPVNPARLRGRRWDLAVSLAGVSVNLALALTALLVYRVLLAFGWMPVTARPDPSTLLGIISLLLRSFIMLNVVLAFFNMLPIPPLDGSHVLLHFIKSRDSAAFRLFELLERYGFVILLLLVVTGLLGYVVGPLLGAVFLVLGYVFQIPLELLFVYF